MNKKCETRKARAIGSQNLIKKNMKWDMGHPEEGKACPNEDPEKESKPRGR